MQSITPLPGSSYKDVQRRERLRNLRCRSRRVSSCFRHISFQPPQGREGGLFETGGRWSASECSLWACSAVLTCLLLHHSGTAVAGAPDEPRFSYQSAHRDASPRSPMASCRPARSRSGLGAACNMTLQPAQARSGTCAYKKARWEDWKQTTRGPPPKKKGGSSQRAGTCDAPTSQRAAASADEPEKRQSAVDASSNHPRMPPSGNHAILHTRNAVRPAGGRGARRLLCVRHPNPSH